MSPQIIKFSNIFNELISPSAGPGGKQRFQAQPIPGFEGHRIARDNTGLPVALISIKSVDNNRIYSPIELEHLHIIHNIECIIVDDKGHTQENRRFTLIQCMSNDPVLREHFFRLLEGIIPLLGASPSQQEVSLHLNKLIELFRAMSKPALKTVQGFWAELLVIVKSSNPVLLVESWHIHIEDLYDFSQNNQRLEVKSTQGRIRKHHFSLNQLQPDNGIDIIIGSILMEKIGLGTSLLELIEDLRSKVNFRPDLLNKIDYIVMFTLGDTWKEAFATCFDKKYALNSLQFYSVDNIPCIENVPPEINQVHFTASLVDVPHLTKHEQKVSGGLHAAAIPHKI